MLSHTRRKNSLDSQSAFCSQSAVYILYLVYTLYLVYILYPVCSLQSAFCTNRYPWHQYSLFFFYSYSRNTHNLPQPRRSRVFPHFFSTLAASCVLYNRTEHSQGFSMYWVGMLAAFPRICLYHRGLRDG